MRTTINLTMEKVFQIIKIIEVSKDYGIDIDKININEEFSEKTRQGKSGKKFKVCGSLLYKELKDAFGEFCEDRRTYLEDKKAYNKERRSNEEVRKAEAQQKREHRAELKAMNEEVSKKAEKRIEKKKKEIVDVNKEEEKKMNIKKNFKGKNIHGEVKHIDDDECKCEGCKEGEVVEVKHDVPEEKKKEKKEKKQVEKKEKKAKQVEQEKKEKKEQVVEEVKQEIIQPAGGIEVVEEVEMQPAIVETKEEKLKRQRREAQKRYYEKKKAEKQAKKDE